ncbi:MAG: hypothetical protein EOM67_05640, partial [Spirochaetia bacterium]|nr:hypothetical protein [Spirochaetia bacterium]
MNRDQVFVKKRDKFDVVSTSLCQRIEKALHIKVTGVVYALYEIEGLGSEELAYFENEILADPITDEITHSIETSKGTTLAYTFLAGHFDQRAYYALQAGKLILENSKDFTIRSSTVIVFDAIIPTDVLDKIRTFLINRVDTRERGLAFEEMPIPTEKHIKDVSNLKEFTPLELKTLKEELALTMNIETLIYIQSYYKEHNKQ